MARSDYSSTLGSLPLSNEVSVKKARLLLEERCPCSAEALLKGGTVEADGPFKEVVQHPSHPRVAITAVVSQKEGCSMIGCGSAQPWYSD